MPDYLFEDPPANGMTHALVQCLSSKKHPGKVVHKIRSVYASEQDARDDAPRLQQADGAFDTYVTEIGKWTLCPPDNDTISDINYQESTLNDIVKGALKNRQDAKALFEQRKRDILLNGLDAENNVSTSSELHQETNDPNRVTDEKEKIEK